MMNGDFSPSVCSSSPLCSPVFFRRHSSRSPRWSIILVITLECYDTLILLYQCSGYPRMLPQHQSCVLWSNHTSWVGLLLSLFGKIKIKGTNYGASTYIILMAARVGDSMRVDQGRTDWSLLAMKIKARTIAGRGGKSLRAYSDPGSELHPGQGE